MTQQIYPVEKKARELAVWYGWESADEEFDFGNGIRAPVWKYYLDEAYDLLTKKPR